MTFTNRVTAITQDVILPKEVDNFFGDNSFIPYRFVGTGDEWTGTSLKVPITIAKNTNGRSFSGMATAPVATMQTRVNMEYSLKSYRISVTIPGLDKVVNRGEEAICKLVANEMQTAFYSLLDDVSTMFYADGTGNGSQDFLGLDALADDGTTATTIGGLSRTTYSTLQGVRTSVSNTLTLDKMATFAMGLSSGSGVKNRPTEYVSDETVWNLVEKLVITGTIQANYNANGYPMVTRRSKAPIRSAELNGGYGFQSIIYRGVPIIYDEKCTAQTLWGLNDNFLTWYGAKSDDLKAISLPNAIDGVNDMPSEDTGIQWSGFKEAFAEFGEAAFIYLIGEWITTQPRRQGRLTSVVNV